MFKVAITDYVTQPDIESKIFGTSATIECFNTENEDEFPESIEEAEAL